ncbi:hypothetical protein JTE90_009889 [Oedothorax gibbosus]|uniref:Prokineticin domain-containing protein n=1 Tax=Oedothorax gibbosus TaxID=931172 RepID=A0AAV6UX02_9ARAC|nr:hypothetical protein JTE90_009889 [Oedothorax gibbosus]
MDQRLKVFLAFSVSLFCKRAEDCDKLTKDGAENDHCCMATDMVALEGRGLCVRLARDGQRCHKENAALEYYGNKFIRYCPCKPGFECKERVDRNFTDPLQERENRRCQAKEETTTLEAVPT